MDAMRKVGLVLIIPGILMLIIMILPLFLSSIPREGLPWTYTWASILGLFFFSAGLALIWVTGGIGITRNQRSRRN